MSDLSIELFGIPRVERNGEGIDFPYSKVNALVYYLAVNGATSREELAGLLWPDEREDVAKKNLRNAIYRAKKTVGLDFIISPKKSILLLDPDMDITCDACEFSKDPENQLQLYKGDFLQGFSIKDSEQFDYWVLKMRRFYDKRFSNYAYMVLNKAVEEGRFDHVEKGINTLVARDEYDERNVRLLMRFYAKTGRPGKVIQTYYKLKKVLRDDLGVSPDSKTQAIYEEVVGQIKISKKKPKKNPDFFYGRYQERARIQESFRLQAQGQAISFLIEGETGIGKTSLIHRSLAEGPEDLRTVEVLCYQAEKDYPMRSFGLLVQKLGKGLEEVGGRLPVLWNSTMQKLFPPLEESFQDLVLSESFQNLNQDQLVQVVVDAMKEFLQEAPLVVIFEDIQWMDSYSLRLLTSVILRTSNRVVFLLSMRPEGKKWAEPVLAPLIRTGRLDPIHLPRFNEEESYDLVQTYLSQDLGEEWKPKIYKETEGNPFFLVEYGKLIHRSDPDKLLTKHIIDAMRARFAYLSKSERDLLNIISYFYDEAPLSILTDLTGWSDLDIIGILESLEDAYVLEENPHKKDVGIQFTHVKLREFFYMTQPYSKKKVIHRMIAELLEKNLKKKKSLYLYSKLIYHYRAADDEYKAIKYELENLNYYLNFSHELFPILTIQDQDERNHVYIPREEIKTLFQSLEDRFHWLEKDRPDLDLTDLTIQYHYMRGRYRIRDGAYPEGLQDIHYVIKEAKDLGDQDYVLEGYKQLIFYNIQTNQAQDMARYIEDALNLAVQCNYHKEIGILLRLKGLYNIMIGRFGQAEQLLVESINTFTVTQEVANRYAVNIGAAYNYIGEIRFQQGRYQEAVAAYDKALDLSEGKHALSSMSIFYINKGKALFAQGKYGEAEDELNKAYALYGQFDSFWKRPVLDAYMALCQMQDGHYDQAVTSILHAIEIAGSLDDPRAQGTVSFALVFLLNRLPKEYLQNNPQPAFRTDIETYKQEALDLLDGNRDGFELGLLKDLD